MNSNAVHKQPKERIIKLSDLFWRIIFGWRCLFVSAVVFAIGVSGIKYVNDCRQNEAAKQVNSEVGIEHIEKQLTEEEADVLQDANELRTHISGLEEYREKSILMNLEGYAENVVAMQYYVDTNYSFHINETITSNNTENIVAAYVSYIENNGIYNELEKQLQWDTETCYISELISTDKNENVFGTGRNVNTSNIDESTNFSSGKGTFTICIKGETPEKADELATVVNNLVMQYQENLVEKIGEHKLVMIDRSSSVTVDTKLAEEQAKLRDSIKKQKQELKLLVEDFSANQLAVWNGTDEMEGEAAAPETVETKKPAISVKYLVLGAFAGLLLSCMWIVCRFIWNNQLQSVEELQQMYGLRGFGNLPEMKKRKNIFSAVDEWLQRLRDKEQWTEDERKELVATNIKVICRKEQVQKIFLTSSVHMTEADKTEILQLMEELKKHQIEAEYGECIMSNAASMERMSEIGQVVFVEKSRVSRYQTIENQIGLCCDSGINILGAFVL